MTKVKLIDVANKAGISKSTVSQYLNGRFDYMSEKTKQRIKVAIDELDYVPNPIARSLKTAKTNTIGVIVRDVTGAETGPVLRGIDDFCKNSDYNVMIYNTDFDSDIEAKSLRALNQLNVDGIIIASTGKNTELIDQYTERGMPIVQFQLEHDGLEKNMIVSDYRQGAYDATQYLISLGHRRICFITQQFENVKSRNDRYLGYIQALEKNNIEVDSALIKYWDRYSGFVELPTEILKIENPPTAFFTQHSAVTTGLLNVLNNEDISIPNDVSVLGFDDIPMADFFKVPITVIKQEPYKVGVESSKLLLDILAGKERSKKLKVPCRLIKRDSCQPL